MKRVNAETGNNIQNGGISLGKTRTIVQASVRQIRGEGQIIFTCEDRSELVVPESSVRHFIAGFEWGEKILKKQATADYNEEVGRALEKHLPLEFCLKNLQEIARTTKSRHMKEEALQLIRMAQQMIADRDARVTSREAPGGAVAEDSENSFDSEEEV